MTIVEKHRAVNMICRCLIIFFVVILVPGLSANPTLAGRISQDQLGRNVIVPENPRRIVSLAPSITEIIFALRQENRLIGVTLYSDFPREARQLPKVGSYVNLDLEKIVALQPDLCIAIKDGNPKRVVDRLESLKIPIYAVDPRNLESVMDAIVAVGTLLHAGNQANMLIQQMRSRINHVKGRVEKTSNRPSVFFQIGVSPIVSVGTNTFIHELIEMAGGKNLAAGTTPYPRFNWEQLVALSPEVIIITPMSKTAVFEQVKQQWNQWPRIPAIQNQRIYMEDSNLFDRPSPRLVDALEVLAKLIHPELFEEKLQ